MTPTMMPKSRLILHIAVLWVIFTLNVYGQRKDGKYWPCNPMKNVTCPPNLGLNQYSYYIDFTNPSTDPSKDWSTSDYATVTYNTKGENGAEFTFAKRYNAPQLFTDFYIFFGRVDVEMQVAPGVGIISSSVLMSDDFDEIDWEMSGNNFNLNTQYPNGVVQNNYFSKGITGSYDRGLWVPCTNPQTTFHTYSVDWTPTKVDWLLDGKVIRTLLASNADTTTHQFPQTPAKVQLGLWDGGDPDQNSGTLSWAGGKTNLSGGPYTMFVKNVRITNYNPAMHYNWTDQSGSWKSIKALNASLSTSTTTTAAASTATTAKPLRTDLPISPNGRCGSPANAICKDSLFGDCCSAYGYCGNTTEYCGLGCQSEFGICGAQNPAATTGGITSPTTSPAATPKKPSEASTSTTATGTTLLLLTTPVSPAAQPHQTLPPVDPANSPRPTSHSPSSPQGPATPDAAATPSPAPLEGIHDVPSLVSEPHETAPGNQQPAAATTTPSTRTQDAKTMTTTGQTGAAALKNPPVTPAGTTTATAAAAQKTQTQPPPLAVPVRRFCFWWRAWVCFTYRQGYPVSIQVERLPA
ncbi:concanavalin A-like lectin/glucanase domain-containing protein [Biscogniauxia mediterranea]|nr:concanavalin A-like lectin/glucanase domain-containing protein [Biscogniauxia mediterranea]